ncbi:FAD-binding domain-containing protein [Limtongia smithiae]|uniref:FAD-binding domain-containing protein n=1 Tax=Limtongia smithiae TaxID=1125753 RepID=UPI0034CE0884
MEYNFANMGQGRFNADGTPRPGYLARMYWAVIGSVCGFALLLRVLDFSIARCRKRQTGLRAPSILTEVYANTISQLQILVYPSIPLPRWISPYLHLPTIGRGTLALCYMCMMLAFFFYKNSIKTSSDWEDAGYRSAWLSLTQLPLITLLSTKRINAIAFVTGSAGSYTLNFFHRWVARGLLLTTTLHMFYMMRYYASFEFLVYELTYDPTTRRGLGAWCLVAWIVVLTTLRPFRAWVYELFFVNHVISTIAFFVVLYKHAPSYSRVYIYISIGIWAADVAARWVMILVNNIGPGFLRYRAEVVVCEGGDALEITIRKPAVALRKWAPGQYVSLSFPTVAPFTAHPFTILSSPEDGEMKFVVKKKSGFTKFLARRATSLAVSSTASPRSSTHMDISSEDDEQKFQTSDSVIASFSVIVDGPYGGASREWKKFDTVSCIATGVGATAALPIARAALTTGGRANNGSVRAVSLVWIVRDYSHLLPFLGTLDHMLDFSPPFSSSENDEDTPSLSVRIHITSAASTPPTPLLQRWLKSHASSPYFRVITDKKPDIDATVSCAIQNARGEAAIAVCGGPAITRDVKNSVARLLDARGVRYANGTSGGWCFVHSEGYLE